MMLILKQKNKQTAFLSITLFFLTALSKCTLILTMNSVGCACQTGPPTSTQEDPAATSQTEGHC